MTLAIFDLDGTLADTLRDLADATNYGLEQLGLPTHPYDSYRQFVGNGAVKLCERALPQDKNHLTMELHGLFSQYYGSHFFDKTTVYDGIPEMLRRLADAGVVLAVATNKPENFAQTIVSELLSDFSFIKVLGGRPDREKKPDPAIIREILEALPEKPEKTFMIGDSNVDIQTAKNSGLTSIGCPWGFRGEEELRSAGADFIAGSPGDIANIILR
ncbi:MAG TPA: phosphoglycolate phosphatase [Ruminococcus sp.]|nr:phosphoglycolate phosphatase [Ruminococcus sp.]